MPRSLGVQGKELPHDELGPLHFAMEGSFTKHSLDLQLHSVLTSP